jgi:hypothetical protein
VARNGLGIQLMRDFLVQRTLALSLAALLRGPSFVIDVMPGLWEIVELS